MGFLYFLLLIGVLITVHEFGHFIVARMLGVRVLKFSIGFGPRLVSFQRGHTEYTIALLPLGGYVKMEGDDPTADVDPDLRAVSFLTQPLWKRYLIVLAGPVANFILPLFVLLPLALTDTTLQPSLVGQVKPDGPAGVAGLLTGDRITHIDDQTVRYWYQIKEIISARAGQELSITYEREGQSNTVPVHVRVYEEAFIPDFYTHERGLIDVNNVFLEPRVHVVKGSPAARAGLPEGARVLAVDGRPVARWHQVDAALQDPDRTQLVLQVQRSREGAFASSDALTRARVQELADAALQGWPGRLAAPSWVEPVDLTLRRAAGEAWGLRSREFMVADVLAGAPAAEQIGLRVGDDVLRVDGRAFGSWAWLYTHLIDHVGDEHSIEFERDGRVIQERFTLQRTTAKGEFNMEHERVDLGALAEDAHIYAADIPNDALLGYAVWKTWDETSRVFGVTLVGIAGMMAGAVPLKQVGGPILIAQVTSRSAQEGWFYFFKILVWISINLGFINLLPIPVLDGGHILLFTVELVRRKPLSMKSRQIVAYMGLAFILVMTVLIFWNDIARNWDSIRGFFSG